MEAESDIPRIRILLITLLLDVAACAEAVSYTHLDVYKRQP